MGIKGVVFTDAGMAFTIAEDLEEVVRGPVAMFLHFVFSPVTIIISVFVEAALRDRGRGAQVLDGGCQVAGLHAPGQVRDVELQRAHPLARRQALAQVPPTHE